MDTHERRPLSYRRDPLQGGGVGFDVPCDPGGENLHPATHLDCATTP